ncbi:MAG: DNA ligase D [Solirubrobacterales bacterium]
MTPASERKPPNMPDVIEPMKAKLAEAPSKSENWATEIKWDGVRAISFCENGVLRLQGRNLNDITDLFPEIAPLADVPGVEGTILDGELVAFDEHGVPDFQRIQKRLRQKGGRGRERAARSYAATFVIFDLLHADGEDLRPLPYKERRDRLEALDLSGRSWQTPDYLVVDIESTLEATAQQGLEGLVVKRLDSPYRGGRANHDWLKLKNRLRQEFVVGGWLPGKGSRENEIGSLLLGYWSHRKDRGEHLRYAGRVGSGFSAGDLETIRDDLAGFSRDTSPFEDVPDMPGAEFVNPLRVVEVEFSEWTNDSRLRHPGLHQHAAGQDPGRSAAGNADRRGLTVGLTADADPVAKGKFTIQVEGRSLRLSNLDRILYPETGFTKGDLIDFYAAVAPAILPHLEGRPLTMRRFPGGVNGKSFWEKRCPAHRPDWVKTESVWSESNDDHIDFCVAEDVATLVWAANLADIEMHTSLATARERETPRAVVFDLDPGEPADIMDCAELALTIRGMLAGAGLETFVKTSGSKGMQLYLPLNDPGVDYERTKTFAHRLARMLEKELPDQVISRMKRSLREGKVFVDWSQNVRHKTTVCAYSMRARPEPSVSTPVTWEEVESAVDAGDADRLRFGPDEVLTRIDEKGDVFADLLVIEQELPEI